MRSSCLCLDPRVCVCVWLLGRYIVQSLPLILVGGILVVMAATKALQVFQSRVLHVLPFGSLAAYSLSDVCMGIFVR
jgi:hypothetical protein